MFETGKADLLVPASRTPRRDQLGEFVPVARTRATLISLKSERAAIVSLQELLDRREMRLAVVRGFDYGEAYQRLVTELVRQGRLVQDTDPLAVARLLKDGFADLTLMAPSIFVSAMLGDARYEALVGRLRFEPVEELPWVESGIYMSKTAMSEADRAGLRSLLDRHVKSGAAWRVYQKSYPPGTLNEGMRPLNGERP